MQPLCADILPVRLKLPVFFEIIDFLSKFLYSVFRNIKYITIIMEEELGRAYHLSVIRKRLWYAPWRKKTIGIRFNMFFIPLKQPAPAIFNKAVRKCGRLKMWGNKGRLGSDWSWHIIFDEKNRIDAFLTENGGEALPDKVMSEDGEICYANGNVRNIPQGALKCKKYPYRPLVKADKG